MEGERYSTESGGLTQPGGLALGSPPLNGSPEPRIVAEAFRKCRSAGFSEGAVVFKARNRYYPAAKRVLDVILGCLALLAALPILGAAALLIWLVDGSPVLFVQKRVGGGGAEFDMFKLRTMVVDARESQGALDGCDAMGPMPHKTRNDPRVTRVGRALRRFSIDELPQLINVLKGEMSLVGPRPELPSLVREYEPWQFQRLSVPQGITGWWQITGRSDRPMHLNTQADLYYVENRSFWLDLQIMLRTIWVVLLGRGAY